MESAPEPGGRRARAAALARGALECVVLALVSLAPWALGSVHAAFEGLLYAGVALLLLLWAARALLDGTPHWRRCPVVVCLAGLFLLGVAQMIPLPRAALARVSPATASLYDELLPAERETLPPPATIPPAALPAGQTLSLYPGGTRAELFRLLAAFLLFAAVRYNAASPAPLRRLAVAATVNGAALALFAFVQFFASPRGVLSWSIPKAYASPFGPFVCRNHYPFYLNLCVGLAAGLLLARRHGAGGREPVTRSWWNVFELLNDPAALWTVLALALMLASVAFSLSRGGVVALAAGCAACLLLRAARSSRPARWGGGLLAAALALGLLAWLGAGPLRARLGTLWEGAALEDGRAEVWATALPAAKDFPLLGTGYGSFEFVELHYRQGPSRTGLGYDHAHNDYLEALVEGGVVRLLLSVAAVLLVYRLGWRALRRYRGGATEGLVLGALLGFTAVAAHSAVDFGLHVPAVAALTAVVAAQVAALGEKRPGPEAAPARRGRVAALALAGAAPLLGLVLCAEGWRMARAESLRLGSRREGGDAGLALIEAATRAAPELADLHLEAARDYGRRYEQEADEEPGRAERDFLLPALAHYVQARDLCPLSSAAHLRLAVHQSAFGRADPRDVYVARALAALSSDPELYYLAGGLELDGGERARAAAHWRRSLELADTYRQQIVERARGVLTDGELLAQVLPGRPAQLFAAAAQLHPEPDDPGRRPFYEKALGLLRGPGTARSAEDFHLKAVLHEALGQPDEALVAYEAALARAPREAEWRCEYARLLRGRGRLEEARRQAREVLADRADHPEGLRLLHAIARDMAEKR